MFKIIISILSLLLITGCTTSKIDEIADKEIDLTKQDDLLVLEEATYDALIASLGEEYYIENIMIKHVSKEYLDEVEYNSKTNIYFGYSLAELYNQFDNESFIFSVDANGETTVKLMEGYDDSLDNLIKGVATGTGVVIVAVTIGVVAAGSHLVLVWFVQVVQPWLS